MTKKELEKRVSDLERDIGELKSQMLALSLRQPQFIPQFIPTPQPTYTPWNQPQPWQPAWPQPNYPIITCQNS